MSKLLVTPEAGEPATEVIVEVREEDRMGTVRDPVCGMDVDPARAAGRERCGDETYPFCSTPCRGRFREDPARYAGREAR